MDPIPQLRAELARSIRGDAWHGPALSEALADVDAEEAGARPIDGAHSIGEIALHAIGWIEEVVRRLQGGAPALPARGDWPAVTRFDDASWNAVKAQLLRAQQALDAALVVLPPQRLEARVGGAERDAPLGTGVTVAAMLHGLAQHNAYHAGQVALLKRVLRAGSPATRPLAPPSHPAAAGRGRA